MTDDEREEGGKALAAVIIGPNVAWGVLSEAVRERYMRAYEAAVAVHRGAEWEAYVRLPSALLRRKWDRREARGDDA